ncbi:MAG: hypothetical protein G01um101444_220 [Parcubacteria group bacterium Gr01-1014_44]|nr:MAG: hypothetical protein G01um101444_220 [Parcubacteria group bacterium Gr01-1014_44]
MPKKGVCCKCQRTHPVVLLTRPLREGEDETKRYMMDRHQVSGEMGPECEGRGTTPQVIVRS